MSNLERRLRRLERIHSPKKARCIVVSASAGLDDDGPADNAVKAFLTDSGLETTERDLVVTVLSRRDRNEPERPALSLLYVKDL